MDRPTELEYRGWHTQHAIPLTRLGLGVSILNWIAVFAVLAMTDVPDLGRTIGWVSILVLPPLLSALAATRGRSRRWMVRLTALTNGTAGVAAVLLCFETVHKPEISLAATLFISQFAFTIFRIPTVMATLAVSPYVALHVILTVASYEGGTLDRATAMLSGCAAGIGMLSGVLAGATIERSWRERFRQERIIDVQRQAIERERTRADVAERSRELSEALAGLAAAGRSAGRLQPGDTIAERYRVVRPLGAGGMGEVHEVERLADARRFALKVLTGTTDRDALMRFAREARIAATLDHPNVVGIFDVGVAPSGMYLVMELVVGSSLASAASRYGDPRWALIVLRQVADALAAMHDRGIVHRDLKPGNILLAGDHAKVTDFGISSLAERPADGPIGGLDSTQATFGDPALTATGIILGTPLYMAPELIGGVRDAQPSSDIWSFGVIAHELMTGGLPFPEAPLRARIAGRPLPAPAPLQVALDGSLREILERCLDQDPAARPTARGLRAALQARAATDPVRA